MTIGDKEYKEIVVTTSDGEVVAVISDTEIIEKDAKARVALGRVVR